VAALDQARLVVLFDWPSWQDEAAHYGSDPHAPETADLLALHKLLTTHVRSTNRNGDDVKQLVLHAAMKNAESSRRTGHTRFEWLPARPALRE
jgi:hypothetical protein